MGEQAESFEAFLTRRLPVMEQRENIGAVPLPPVEVWNRKMRGYARLEQAAAHAVIVRYEDFLVDEAAALERAAAALGIAMRPRHTPVPEGVKRDDRTLSRSDYAAYYLAEGWRGKLSKEALEIINAALDPDIVARFGYEIIAPAKT